jgi:hypothetical protein
VLPLYLQAGGTPALHSSHRRKKCATKFKRIKPLKDISIKQRGWTLDVLNVVRRISEGQAPRDPDQSVSETSGTRGTRPSGEFITADVYAFTRELEKLHPDNSESFREQADT